MSEKMFNVGKIVNTHGIKGEVKVLQITDFEERFEPGSTVFWVSPNGNETLSLEITSHRMHKNFHMLQFKGYPSINDVERFKGGMLKVSEDQLTELDEGEFYYHQIIGAKVFDEENNEIGEIKEILAPGANDVWVVKRKGKKDVLIPYIDAIVKEVNMEEKTIIIHPMEGLID